MKNKIIRTFEKVRVQSNTRKSFVLKTIEKIQQSFRFKNPLLMTLLIAGTAHATWTRTSYPITGSVYCFAASGSNLFAGALNGGIYISSDVGSSWTESDAGLPANSTVLSLLSNGGYLFAGNYGAGVYMSNNNGSSWTAAAAGLPANASITALIANGPYIFAGTNGNGIYSSGNNGATWTAVNNGLQNTSVVSALAANGSSIFAATQTGMFISNNNGSTWTAINSNIAAGALINAIVANGNTLYAASNNNGIYYSSNNGTTWATINSGLQGNVDILSLAINGSDIYAGAIGQVYHSTGTVWSLADTGLTSANNVTALCVVNGSALVAGGGNGVWKITLPPAAPTSFVPSNNTTDQPVSMVFSWNAVSLATTYGMQLSTDSTFSASISYNTSGLTSTSLTIGGLTNNTAYYWRVNAANTGGTSSWSAMNKFTTALLSPTPITPTANAINQPVSLLLSWNPVGMAMTYGVQVSTDSTFSSSIVFSQSGLTTSSQQISGLLNNTAYYWRVNAANAGGTSAWSGNSRFTTIVSMPAAPQLGIPSNNVAGQPVSLTLSWYAVTSSNSYSLQVSTDSTFATSIIYGQSNLTGTSQVVGGLTNNTTYYWRVNATNMAGTGPWSTVNRFTTILATPTLATPASGTTNMPDSFIVYWNGVPAATSYGVQVGTDSTFNASLAFSQTGITAPSQKLTGLNSNTVYYWRVNATNAGGTSAWSAKYVFTTIIAAPLPPAPLSPLSGAVNQPVSVSISWGAVANANSYALQISTDSTFATAVVYSQTGILAVSQTINGLGSSTTYYWRVSATNLAGSSGWSTVGKFSTIISAPTLLAPVNAATGQLLSMTFQWNPVASAGATYTLQVSTDSNFVTSPFFNQNGLTSTTQVVNNLLNNTVYFWRVNATGSGGTSTWSAKNQFTTLLAAPTLVSPVRGASNQPISITATWGAVPTATSYGLQVSTDSTFASALVYNQSGLTTTSQVVGGLVNNTAYYWRVNASNTGSTSAWSAANGFSTVLLPPTLSAPLNGSTNQATTVTLAWNAVTSAGSYGLQVSTDSTFASVSFSQTGIVATAQTVSGLINNSVYYWRVNSANSASTGSWSSKFHFTTIIGSSIAPTIIAPANGAIGQPIALVLSWNAVVNAASYGVQVSTDSTFKASMAYNNTGLTATSVTINGLVNNAVYYWRVNASNAGSTGAWSIVSNFATILVSPTPTAPAMNAVNQPTTVTFAWSPVALATGYTLQVSTDSMFASANYNQSGLTATTQTVSGLANNILYYWRVNVSSSISTSGWSPNYHFWTVIAPSSFPVAIAPANGVTNQPIALTLSWNPVGGALSYSVQVSTDSTFSSALFFNQGGVTTTTQPLTGLANGTTYFWRLSVSNVGGMGGWSPPNRFTTKILAPVATLPANNSSNQPLAPTLYWNPVSVSQSFALQVSTDSTFATAAVFNQGGLVSDSQALSGLSNNTSYYWRVNTTNALGTSDWSTKSRFTTIVVLPSVPALLTPAIGAINQPLSLNLTWGQVSGAQSYQLQVSTDSTFKTGLLYNLTNLTSMSQNISGLLNNRTYYWHVSQTNPGGTSAWSSVNGFSTTLAAPIIALPVSGATNQSTSLKLSWNAVASTAAVTYAIQVSTDSTFTSSVIYSQTGIAAATQTVNGLANSTAYYWRVCATNALGGVSAWSSTAEFMTVSPAPTPISPTSTLSQAVTFQWNAVAGAASYSVQVATDSTFVSGIVFNQSGITATSVTAGNLASGAAYYWHVNAVSVSGASAWSAANLFTTVAAAPVLIAPVNSANNVAITVSLSWNAVKTATAYSLQVSPDSTFAAPLMFNGTATTQAMSGLTNNTVYYWRVSATNAGGTSAWSARYQFTTIVAPPAAPKLSGTGNNASASTITLSLTWDSVANANSYLVQVAKDSLFGQIVYSETGPATSIQVMGLAINAIYYWRVNATNAGGTGPWSLPNYFQVQNSTAIRNRLNKALPKAFDLSGAGYLKSGDCITVSYAVPANLGTVLIRLFDVKGRVVATLASGTAEAGYATASMDLRSGPGRTIGSGIYLCRMEAPGFTKAKTLTVP